MECMTEQKEKNLIVGMQEYTVNAQYTKYMNHPEKMLKEDFATSQRGTFRIETTQIRWFLGQSDESLDVVRGGQRHSNLS
jgi:hypothetical protein